MENKDSSRTKKIKEAKIEDDFLGIKSGIKAATVKASELGDRLGFTQEDYYGPKQASKEPPKEAEKKAKGGMISSASKRADGCAVRGKTKGRMV
jgi:hypothetical protein